MDEMSEKSAHWGMAEASAAARGLKRLRVLSGLTVREVAAAIGRPASTYSAYEDKYKKRSLPIDLINALLPVLTQRGIPHAELMKLGGIDSADIHRSGHVQSIKRRGDTAHIEEVDVTASAGHGAIIENPIVVRVWQLPPDIVSIATDSPLGQIKIIRVRGDSMSPTYGPIDRIMVDTGDVSPTPPGVFVVWDGLGFVLKRVQLIPHSEPLRVRMTSDNAHYEPYERVLGEAYIQGRVIGKWLWA